MASKKQCKHVFDNMNKKNESMLKQGLKFNESARIDIKSSSESDPDPPEDDDQPPKQKTKQPHKLEYRIQNYKKQLTKITMDFNDTFEEIQQSKQESLNNCKEFNLNYGVKKGKKLKNEDEQKSFENGHKLTLGFKNNDFTIKDLKYSRDLSKYVYLDFKIVGTELIQVVSFDQKISPYLSLNLGLETTLQLQSFHKPQLKPRIKFDFLKFKTKIDKHSVEFSYIQPVLAKKLLDIGVCGLLKDYRLFYL